jgi:hypothetical protein
MAGILILAIMEDRINLMDSNQTRRRFGGRQPLCGIGVTSTMLVTL